MLCVLIVRDINSVAFYFEAFLMLVFSKTYLISRAAVVPTTVRSDRELVEANSKLALLSGMAAIVAGGPGLLLLKIGGDQHGPQLAVGLGAIVFAIGVGFATRLPRVQVAPEPVGAAEKQELRSAGIRLAASAMALLRFAVGLLVLMVAFAFKNGDLPAWTLFGAVVAAQAGVLAGAGLAPRLRLAFTEPRIIIGSLAATMLGGIVAAVLGGPVGAMLLCFLMGTTSGTAKQAFDALVQRDAPDANRGRSFARFETKFQLAWVLGRGHAADPAVPADHRLRHHRRGHGRRHGVVLVRAAPGGQGHLRLGVAQPQARAPGAAQGRRLAGAQGARRGASRSTPHRAAGRARRGARPAWPSAPPIGAATPPDWVPPGRLRVARAQRPDHRRGRRPLPPASVGPGAAGPELFDADAALGPELFDAEAALAPDPPTSPLPPPPAQQPTLPLDFSDPDGRPHDLRRAPLARLADLIAAVRTGPRRSVAEIGGQSGGGRCGPATGRGRRPRPGWAGSAPRTTGGPGPRRRPARPRRPRTASPGRTGPG